MMKWTLLVLWLGIVLSPYVSVGQTRSLQVANKTAFTKLSAQNNHVWEAKADIRNLGSNDVFVNVREVEKNLSSGHKFNYCWGGVCADGENNKSVLPVSISAKEINTSFRVYLKTNGMEGMSSVTYRFSTINNTDSIDIQFVFNHKGKTAIATPVQLTGASAGINANDIAIQGTVDAFPNPASHQTSIEYNLSNSFHTAYVRIYDLMGKEIAQYDLEDMSGTLRINLRNYNDGVYFYTLIADGKSLATKRLVVSK